MKPAVPVKRTSQPNPRDLVRNTPVPGNGLAPRRADDVHKDWGWGSDGSRGHGIGKGVHMPLEKFVGPAGRE